MAKVNIEQEYRYNIVIDQFKKVEGSKPARILRLETKVFPEPLQYGDNVRLPNDNGQPIYIGEVYQRIPCGVSSDGQSTRITEVHTRVEHSVNMDELKKATGAIGAI